MRKRNKESEEKKWWIMEGWKSRNNPPVNNKPVLNNGIFLRDTTYNSPDVDINCKYGYPGGWDAQIKALGESMQPVEIWQQHKPYVRTIDSIRKSWPLYSIENGKFKDYEWPTKPNLNKIRKNKGSKS